MRERLKKLFYLYQRSFWYLNFAADEANKPLRLWNETLLLLTFLAVRGINVPGKWVILTYIAVIFIASVVGKVIVKLGIVKYNKRLGNSQNPELLEILDRVKNIENQLKK